MKKFFAAALAAMLLAGCSFEVKDADPDQEEGVTIDFKEKEDDGEE